MIRQSQPIARGGLQNTSKVEGKVAVNGFALFYESFGESDNILLCLHGGPGATHEYLLPLSGLAGPELRVVMYDQLGCGRSEKPSDHTQYNIDYATEEVEGLRRALNFGRINLFGHSYGGFLALSYALKYQTNLKTLTLSDTAANIQRTEEELHKLRMRLPLKLRKTLDKYELSGDLKNQEYAAALDSVFHRHLCRLKSWPPDVKRLFETLNVDIYTQMWGTNEFVVSGNLKSWNVSDYLSTITIPTLLLVGKYDELPPSLSRDIQKKIRNSKLVVFERGSHLLMFEEPRKYLSAISKFLGTGPSQG